MKPRLTSELEHSPSEMVMQNLMKIKKCVDRMLELCQNSEGAEELILNHAWMVDHVSTSADDLQESCDFMCAMLDEPNSTRMQESDPMNIGGFDLTFESYDYHNVQMIFEKLSQYQIEEIQTALVDRYGPGAVGKYGIDGKLGTDTFNAIMQAIDDAGYKPGAALIKRKSMVSELGSDEDLLKDGMTESEIEWWFKNLGDEFFIADSFFSKNVIGDPWIIDSESPIKKLNWKWYFGFGGRIRFDSGIEIELDVVDPSKIGTAFDIDDDSGYKIVGKWTQDPPVNQQTPVDATEEELTKSIDDYNKGNVYVNPNLVQVAIDKIKADQNVVNYSDVNTTLPDVNIEASPKKRGLFKRLFPGKKIKTKKSSNESYVYTGGKKLERFIF